MCVCVCARFALVCCALRVDFIKSLRLTNTVIIIKLLLIIIIIIKAVLLEHTSSPDDIISTPGTSALMKSCCDMLVDNIHYFHTDCLSMNAVLFSFCPFARTLPFVKWIYVNFLRQLRKIKSFTS